MEYPNRNLLAIRRPGSVSCQRGPLSSGQPRRLKSYPTIDNFRLSRLNVSDYHRVRTSGASGDAELVDAVERGVERGQRSEGESGEAGPGQGRTRNGRKLRRDTRVIDQGPRDNTPAIQISPRAVVEPKGVLLASRPRPPSYLTFRAGFRTECSYPPMRSRPTLKRQSGRSAQVSISLRTTDHDCGAPCWGEPNTRVTTR